jgi:ethanolamine utilization protein EutN
MELARIVGSVVASVKEPRLTGYKLLLAEPVGVDGAIRDAGAFVAVDLVGAGEGEIVVIVRGSPAARAMEAAGAPVDAAVVGIVDSVRAGSLTTYQKH